MRLVSWEDGLGGTGGVDESKDIVVMMKMKVMKDEVVRVEVR